MSEPATDFYSIKVAPGVVAAVIRLATLEVPGVTQLGDGTAFRRLLPPSQPEGGIHLEVHDGGASIDLSVILEREADMQVVCGRVQRAVTEAVSNLVGMPVREVNVVVQDVR